MHEDYTAQQHVRSSQVTFICIDHLQHLRLNQSASKVKTEQMIQIQNLTARIKVKIQKKSAAISKINSKETKIAQVVYQEAGSTLFEGLEEKMRL